MPAREPQCAPRAKNCLIPQPGINPLIYLRQRELERLFEETADDTRRW